MKDTRARIRLVWIVVASLGVAATVAVHLLGLNGIGRTVLTTATLLWLVPGVISITWTLGRRLVYRVGVRLFLSYLLISVPAFLFFAILSHFVLLILMGQYASAQLLNEMEHLGNEIARSGRDAVRAHAEGGLPAAATVLGRAVHETSLPLPRVLWLARFGDDELRSRGAELLPMPRWLEDELALGVVFSDGAPYLMAGQELPTGTFAGLIPLDEATAASLNTELWFDVCFWPVVNESDEGEDNSEGPFGDRSLWFLKVGPDSAPVVRVWGEWEPPGEGLLHETQVYWFRATVDGHDLETGKVIKDRVVLSYLRTSPAAVWEHFTLSEYQLGSFLVLWIGIMAAVMIVVYGLAVAVATKMIVSITRSTARLTRGAKAIEQGRLDHRVPVRQRDQLGDLALAFNRMTESVQGMLAQVAEKERLAHELELAREIQESLLPECYLDHGGLCLRAVFRPAEEVGGDYFDVFPLGDDSFFLAVGDVAGHGLHTGLLMAALKSSVAALIHEGYTGAELLLRVNQELRRQGRDRNMATMAFIEFDLVNHLVRVTNAGHPPPYLMAPDQAPVELLAGALPLGTVLCQPAVVEHTFVPGSRLVVYTDGLVEGLDQQGNPFGFEALTQVLRTLPDVGGADLLATVVEHFDRHSGGRPLQDDLTVLVIERSSTAKPRTPARSDVVSCQGG